MGHRSIFFAYFKHENQRGRGDGRKKQVNRGRREKEKRERGGRKKGREEGKKEREKVKNKPQVKERNWKAILMGK